MQLSTTFQPIFVYLPNAPFFSQEEERRKQAGAKILEEFHNPHHLAASPDAAAAPQTPNIVSAVAPQSEQDTEAALRKSADLFFPLAS